MLINNEDVSTGWVNGRSCMVEQLCADMVIVSAENDRTSRRMIRRITRVVPETPYSRTQFPLILGYALTIHKVQELTLPKVTLFLGNLFAPGLLYVALSRVRNLDDLFIRCADGADNFDVPYNNLCLLWIKYFKARIEEIQSQE